MGSLTVTSAAELARANTELKGFAYIVSHNLKAPLRAISSLVNWLNDKERGVA